MVKIDKSNMVHARMQTQDDGQNDRRCQSCHILSPQKAECLDGIVRHGRVHQDMELHSVVSP